MGHIASMSSSKVMSIAAMFGFAKACGVTQFVYPESGCQGTPTVHQRECTCDGTVNQWTCIGGQPNILKWSLNGCSGTLLKQSSYADGACVESSFRLTCVQYNVGNSSTVV